MAHDPYRVLGVARTASQDDIKAAFRKFAKQHHPDLNKANADAEANFRAGAAAYELLGDPARRARFDSGAIDAEGKAAPPRAEPDPPDMQAHTDYWREHTEYRHYARQAQAETAQAAFADTPYRGSFGQGAQSNPKRAASFANWGAVAMVSLLLAIVLASQYEHSWRGRFGQAEFAIMLVLLLIRWAASGFGSRHLDGATQGCIGLALLLGGSGVLDFLDRNLNGRFKQAGYPPFFGDFVGAVCLATAILLCVPAGRRAALAGFAAFLLAGGILGVMQGQPTQVHVTMIMLPICIGLLLACEAQAAGGRWRTW